MLFKNSLGFLFPSLSEGFGLPGLEAIASGTLVLASDTPVFREIYRDSVLYFNPFDFSSIQKKLEEVVIMDKKEREKIITKAQRFINKYDWQRTAQQTLKVYQKL